MLRTLSVPVERSPTSPRRLTTPRGPARGAGLARLVSVAAWTMLLGCTGSAPDPAAHPSPRAVSAPAPVTPGCAAALEVVFAPAERAVPGVYVATEADAVRTALGPAWQTAVTALAAAPAPGSLKLTYPLEGAVFPQDLSAPTLRFTDPVSPGAEPPGGFAPDRWIVEFALADGAVRIQVLTAGFPSPRPVDSRLNVPGAASAPPSPGPPARGWRPSAALWGAIRTCSEQKTVRLSVTGFRAPVGSAVGSAAGAPAAVTAPPALTRATRDFSFSADAVDAPVFFRAVPLPFKFALKNVDKIQWLLGDVRSEAPAHVVMENIPVCANCHSFARDGKTLALDVDYANDKGSYAVTELAQETVLDRSKVLTWSDFRRSDGQPTFGLLSQISPDGRYVVSTVKDMSVFIPAPDLMYSQLFFPIRGILAVYDRQTKAITALPGADDPKLVQSNPTWSPDGQSILFARAEALDVAPPENRQLAVVNREDLPRVLGGKDPLTYDQFGALMEGGRKFRYDLYRVPFNGGKGGVAEPLRGASANGRSNFFARYTPDGRFIVFCQNDSFMLLRFDSALYIMPAAGGEPRKLAANFDGHMNSWHSFSPNGRWLVWSSKVNGPFTQLWLTHLDAEGQDTPPVLLENFTPANRAANIPEFVNRSLGDTFTVTEAFADAYGYFRQGFQDWQLSDYTLAARELRKALHLAPDDPQSHKYLADALARLGRMDEARPHFERAKALAPNDPELRRMLAEAAGGEGRSDVALAELKAAVRAAPGDLKARAALGRLLLSLGRPAEALPALERSLAGAPGDPALQVLVAVAQTELGHFAVAAQGLRAVLAAQPAHPQARLRLAWLLAAAPDVAVRDGARAVELAEAMCNADRFSVPEELDLLAAAYAEVGRFAEALRLVEDAAHRVAADVARPMNARADLYRRQTPYRLPTE